jgi:hypothetical protein
MRIVEIRGSATAPHTREGENAMKHVVIALLMSGIASCAVESTPASTPTDDTAETSAQLTSTAADGAAPRAIDCTEGSCEPLAQCRAEGGVSTGACIFRGTICCVE